MARVNSKRPTLWYQEAREYAASPIYGSRVRVIYPNGIASWLLVPNLDLVPDLNEKYGDWRKPCWNETLSGDSKATNGREAINLMNEFDVTNGFGPAEFLGYL